MFLQAKCLLNNHFNCVVLLHSSFPHLFRYGALNPLNFLEGIHRHRGWIKAAKLDTEEDFLKYIQRLEALPRQVN